MGKTLALTLALAAVAGCGNAGEAGNGQQTDGGTESAGSTASAQNVSVDIKPEKGASLLIWESDGNEREFLRKVGEQFEAAYGVSVKVEVVPSIDTVGKLMTDGPAGLGADVFSSPHDAIGKAVSAGLLLPNDRTGADVAANVMPSVAQAITYQGTLYGYPMSADTYALYYNKKLLPQGPATFDELLAFGRSFTDPAAKQYGLAWDVAQIYQAHAFIAGYGGYIFGAGGTDPTDIGLNNAGAVQGMEFVRSLKQLFPLNTADINNNVISGLFQEGKAAMMIEGTWQMANLKQAGADYGVVPLPLLPNGEHPQSLISVRSLFVNSYTKYPNAARLFAELATSKDNAKLRYELTAQLPTRQDLMDDPAIKADANVSAFLEQLKHATALPVIPETSTIWVPSYAALSVIWNDERADIKQTLDNMANQMRSAMQAAE